MRCLKKKSLIIFRLHTERETRALLEQMSLFLGGGGRVGYNFRIFILSLFIAWECQEKAQMESQRKEQSLRVVQEKAP